MIFFSILFQETIVEGVSFTSKFLDEIWRFNYFDFWSIPFYLTLAVMLFQPWIPVAVGNLFIIQ